MSPEITAMLAKIERDPKIERLRQQYQAAKARGKQADMNRLLEACRKRASDLLGFEAAYQKFSAAIDCWKEAGAVLADDVGNADKLAICQRAGIDAAMAGRDVKGKFELLREMGMATADLDVTIQAFEAILAELPSLN